MKVSWAFAVTIHLPEQTFPCREVGALEKGVFKNSLYSTKSLNHICPVVVQVPQLAIMSLMCPPKWILLQNLCTHFD
jgi:hypothetical protein